MRWMGRTGQGEDQGPAASAVLAGKVGEILRSETTLPEFERTALTEVCTTLWRISVDLTSTSTPTTSQ